MTPTISVAVPHREVAGVAAPHELRALAIGRPDGDGRGVRAHRLARAAVQARVGAAHHRGEEVALGDEPDELPAAAHADRADVALGHEARGVGEAGGLLEGDEVANDTVLDAGHGLDSSAGAPGFRAPERTGGIMRRGAAGASSQERMDHNLC